jgi:hypothetical protein
MSPEYIVREGACHRKLRTLELPCVRVNRGDESIFCFLSVFVLFLFESKKRKTEYDANLKYLTSFVK